MELLLILAAMISAVTGAFTGARGPEARIHQAEAATPVAAAAVAQVATRRIATAIPENAAFAAEVAALPGFALAAAFPRYADRLLE